MLSFFDIVKQWGFASLLFPAVAGVLLGFLYYKAVAVKNGWLELLTWLGFTATIMVFVYDTDWAAILFFGLYAFAFWVFAFIDMDEEHIGLKDAEKYLSWGRFGSFALVTFFVGIVLALANNVDFRLVKNSLSQQDWAYAKAWGFKHDSDYGGKDLPDSLANFTGYYYLRKAALWADTPRRDELLSKSAVYFKRYLPYAKDGRQAFWQSLYRYTSKAGRVSDTLFFKKRHMYELYLLALYNTGALDRFKLAEFANKVNKKFLNSLSHTFELKQKIEHTPDFLNLIRQALEILKDNMTYRELVSKYDLWFNEQEMQRSMLAYLLGCDFSLTIPNSFGFFDFFPFKFALIYMLVLLVWQLSFWWTARYWVIRVYFKGEKPVWFGWLSWVNLGLRKHSPLIRKFILYLSRQDSQEGTEGLFTEEIELLSENYFPGDLFLALIIAVKVLVYKARARHIKAEAQALEMLRQKINSLSASLIPLGDETVLQIIEGIRSETQNIYYEFLKQGSFVAARQKLLEKLADLKTLRDMLKPSQGNGKVNYYDLLGISPKCSQQEITRAYKKLVYSVHPDKNGGDVVFNNITSLINKAYGVLKDPLTRQAYDASL